jgi:hypothetical protein
MLNRCRIDRLNFIEQMGVQVLRQLIEPGLFEIVKEERALESGGKAGEVADTLILECHLVHGTPMLPANLPDDAPPIPRRYYCPALKKSAADVIEWHQTYPQPCPRRIEQDGCELKALHRRLRAQLAERDRS